MDGLPEVTLYLFHKNGEQRKEAVIQDAEAARLLGIKLGAKVIAVKLAATHAETAWDFETRETFVVGDEVRVKEQYLQDGLIVREVTDSLIARSHMGTRGVVVEKPKSMLTLASDEVYVQWTDDDASVDGWQTSVPARVLEHLR